MNANGATATGILDTTAIMAKLPHRFPFLMVDRILETVPGERLRAVKNVTANEPYFAGHFPGDPIMPGVMILEALAQSGGLIFEIGDRLCVLALIDKVRFRGIVRPGDQLILESSVTAVLSKMGKVSARALVDDAVVASAEITYSFIEGKRS